MKKITLLFILLSVMIVSFGFLNQTGTNEVYVLVKYKAQPNKSEQALVALKNLVNKVKEEPNYKKIIIHTDPADPTNILLYEHWDDEAYYTGDHMNTPHLQKFITDSREFLAGPPEITFWKVVG